MTPAGERVYVEAQRVLGTVKDIRRISDQAQNGSIGRVRVGIAPSLLFGPMPPVLRDFQQRYPDVEFVLERMPTNSLRSLFVQRRLDALLMFSPAKLPDTECQVLYREPFLAALHRDNPLAAFPYIRLAQLRDEQFLCVPREEAPENHDAIVGACMNAGFSPRTKIVLGTYLEHIGFVSAGFGVAIVPETISRYSAPDVVFRPLAEPVMSLEISVSWLEKSRDPAINNLVAFLSAELTKRGFARDESVFPAPEGIPAL
nr:LysR substrate-binding domain-containing protein [Arthrobacter sp. SF27]